MKVRRSILKDTAVVRTRTNEGSYGDVLGDPLTVACYVDETRRVARDGNGQETVSECTLTLHPRTRATAEDGTLSYLDPMDLFTPESEVALEGRTTRVITAKRAKLRGYTTAVEVTCE